jgi:ribosome biogenesis GTPase
MMQQGLVIRSTGSWYKVLPLDTLDAADVAAAPLDCRLRGNYRLRGNKQTNPVAVGDIVDYDLQDDGTGFIGNVHDRRNYIVRRATKLSKQTHVIAANIDRLCIVATLGLPRTSTGFIDRLLVTAEAYHIPAAIVFNKCDLYDDLLWEAHNELKAIYEAAGYPVLEVSALRGDGLDALKALIAGKTVLFSGHSGVGKSALLNALCPGLDLRTGDLSDWSLKGKHTTTFAEIFPISLTPDPSPQGEGSRCLTSTEHSTPLSPWRGAGGEASFLIDTPGIKEFGMVDFNAQELSHFFPEMRPLIPHCHFANCTHTHEPGCAIKKAVDDGFISPERYQNYLNILEDVAG